MKKIILLYFVLFSLKISKSQTTLPSNVRPVFPAFVGWNGTGPNAGPLDVRNDFATQPINFFTGGSAAANQRMIINGSTGFIGMGSAFTSPQSLLHIHDAGSSYLQVTNIATTNAANMGVRFGLFGPQAHAVIAQQTPGFNMYFSTNGLSTVIGNVKMVITPQGSVGIGSGGFTTPNNRLDVDQGDIDVNTAQRSYMIADSSVLWHKGGTANIFVGVGAGNLI